MASLAELCDANEGLLKSGAARVLPPIFRSYGLIQAFSGPVVTLKVFEDNVLVRDLIESCRDGDDRVLLVDGGGSTACSLMGESLVMLACHKGWSGIVVNGCVRDVYQINRCDIGVRALGSHPMKAKKKGIGEKHVPVIVGGLTIRDGEWLYADSDGIVVSETELMCS